jgi:hypothetical protein
LSSSLAVIYPALTGGMAAAIVIPIVVVLIIAAFAIMIPWMRKRFAERLAEADAALEGEDVLMKSMQASCFGVTSEGKNQVRGDGILALTDERLAFFMFSPKKTISIPREKITGVGTPASFLGKTLISPLLEVRFKNEADEDDSTGFWMRDVLDWKSVLEGKTPGEAVDKPTDD